VKDEKSEDNELGQQKEKNKKKDEWEREEY
jgi:hypothetical protein